MTGVADRWSPLERLGFEVAAAVALNMRPQSARMLCRMIDAGGQVVTGRELIACCGERGGASTRGSINVSSWYLRRALEVAGFAGMVQTERGRDGGYLLSEADAASIVRFVEASL